MLPSRHIIASVPLGVTVGFLTQSAFAGLLCFISGALLDLDHLLDYIIHYGLRVFNFKEVYQACIKMPNPVAEGGVKKLYLLLHTAEISVLLWTGYVISKNFYLLSIAVGYTVHLIMDVVGNRKRVKLLTYSLSWRIINGFATERLCRRN